MKKTIIRISCVIALGLLLTGITFAWFANNREADLAGADNIRIKSNGILVAGYAYNSKDVELTEREAKYDSGLDMELAGPYSDVSGDGIELFLPSLDTNGIPIEGKWSAAEADSAFNSADSGHYVMADLYFRSNLPMDIYLMEGSGIEPVSSEELPYLYRTGDGTSDYSGFTKYSEFTNGLPQLNYNQSSYGLFSRNLIAGAARAAFSEYGFSMSDGEITWTKPEFPNLVLVPHSDYKLTVPSDTSVIHTFAVGDSLKEETYTFYTDSGNVLSTVQRRADGTLAGLLYAKKNGSDWECIPLTTLDHDSMVPAKKVTGYTNPIPMIWDSSEAEFSEAGYSTAKKCLVLAVYDKSNSLDSGYAMVTSMDGSEITVQELKDEEGTLTGYRRVVKDASGYWTDGGTDYTSEENISSIEAGFVMDGAEYFASNWMEDTDYTKEVDSCNVSRYKIGTTKDDGTGNCYTRLMIAVWVEGCDRESDVALNSGEFNINLKFYGTAAEQ